MTRMDDALVSTYFYPPSRGTTEDKRLLILFPSVLVLAEDAT